MEEIKLTPEELKQAIDFGKLIGSGFFSRVFTYKGKLIKMDNILYDLLKANNPKLSKDMIDYHYRWDVKDFNNRNQIEQLSKKQPYIRTKVPEGIVTINNPGSKTNGVSPGIIVPHFIGYENLKKIPVTEYKRLLILLRKIFNDIRNLADNEIAQEDIFHTSIMKDTSNPGLYDYNILQKGRDAQIIDMSGPLVKVGKDFTDAQRMYSEFARLINSYYRANNLKPIYEENDDIDEQKLTEMITEFDKQTRKK